MASAHHGLPEPRFTVSKNQLKDPEIAKSLESDFHEVTAQNGDLDSSVVGLHKPLMAADPALETRRSSAIGGTSDDLVLCDDGEYPQESKQGLTGIDLFTQMGQTELLVAHIEALDELLRNRHTPLSFAAQSELVASYLLTTAHRLRMAQPAVSAEDASENFFDFRGSVAQIGFPLQHPMAGQNLTAPANLLQCEDALLSSTCSSCPSQPPTSTAEIPPTSPEVFHAYLNAEHHSEEARSQEDDSQKTLTLEQRPLNTAGDSPVDEEIDGEAAEALLQLSRSLLKFEAQGDLGRSAEASAPAETISVAAVAAALQLALGHPPLNPMHSFQENQTIDGEKPFYEVGRVQEEPQHEEKREHELHDRSCNSRSCEPGGRSPIGRWCSVAATLTGSESLDYPCNDEDWKETCDFERLLPLVTPSKKGVATSQTCDEARFLQVSKPEHRSATPWIQLKTGRSTPFGASSDDKMPLPLQTDSFHGLSCAADELASCDDSTQLANARVTLKEQLHLRRICKPCAYHFKPIGCKNKEQCEFCHHEDHRHFGVKQWKNLARVDVTKLEKRLLMQRQALRVANTQSHFDKEGRAPGTAFPSLSETEMEPLAALSTERSSSNLSSVPNVAILLEKRTSDVTQPDAPSTPAAWRESRDTSQLTPQCRPRPSQRTQARKDSNGVGRVAHGWQKSTMAPVESRDMTKRKSIAAAGASHHVPSLRSGSDAAAVHRESPKLPSRTIPVGSPGNLGSESSKGFNTTFINCGRELSGSLSFSRGKDYQSVGNVKQTASPTCLEEKLKEPLFCCRFQVGDSWRRDDIRPPSFQQKVDCQPGWRLPPSGCSKRLVEQENRCENDVVDRRTSQSTYLDSKSSVDLEHDWRCRIAPHSTVHKKDVRSINDKVVNTPSSSTFFPSQGNTLSSTIAQS